MGRAVQQSGMGAWYNDWLYNIIGKQTASDADPIKAINNWLWNAVTGTESAKQKADLIWQEATALVKASGGKLSWDEAWKIATGDVTKVITAKKADPSQASPGNLALVNNVRDVLPDLGTIDSAIKWGLLGLAGIFLVILVKD